MFQTPTVRPSAKSNLQSKEDDRPVHHQSLPGGQHAHRGHTKQQRQRPGYQRLTIVPIMLAWSSICRLITKRRIICLTQLKRQRMAYGSIFIGSLLFFACSWTFGLLIKRIWFQQNKKAEGKHGSSKDDAKMLHTLPTKSSSSSSTVDLSICESFLRPYPTMKVYLQRTLFVGLWCIQKLPKLLLWIVYVYLWCIYCYTHMMGILVAYENGWSPIVNSRLGWISLSSIMLVYASWLGKTLQLEQAVQWSIYVVRIFDPPTTFRKIVQRIKQR